MFSSSMTHPHLNLSYQNFATVPQQYSDFSGYHQVPGINSDQHHSQTAAWNPRYPPHGEEWTSFCPETVTSTYNPRQTGCVPIEFTSAQAHSFRQTSINTTVWELSPNTQSRRPYGLMRRSSTQSATGGKTRTKDKYRVVYTEYQRLELEKEFHYSQYINIRRKAELATALSLSERQVKIWFQNRRAKEKKVKRKKMQQPQPASTTTFPQPPSIIQRNIAMVSDSSAGLLMPSLTMTIKEEYWKEDLQSCNSN